MTLAPNEVRAVRLFVTAPAGELSADSLPAAFSVRVGEDAVSANTIFISDASSAP